MFRCLSSMLNRQSHKDTSIGYAVCFCGCDFVSHIDMPRKVCFWRRAVEPRPMEAGSGLHAHWAAQEPSRRTACHMDAQSLMEEEWHGRTRPHAPARQQPMYHAHGHRPPPAPASTSSKAPRYLRPRRRCSTHPRSQRARWRKRRPCCARHCPCHSRRGRRLSLPYARCTAPP